jgi:uncharacterized protein YegP (UPF0339 family)
VKSWTNIKAQLSAIEDADPGFIDAARAYFKREEQPMKIEIYVDGNSEYRWRAVEANGRIIAVSGEGYVRFDGAERAVQNVVGEFRGDIGVTAASSTRVRRSIIRDDEVVCEYPAVNVLSTDNTEGES